MKMAALEEVTTSTSLGDVPYYFRSDLINSGDTTFNASFSTNTDKVGWSSRRIGLFSISRENANAFNIRRLGSDGSAIALV